MTQPEISFDGDRQRHEDRPGHGDVRHRVHEVREDVCVRVRRNEKSSAEVNTITNIKVRSFYMRYYIIICIDILERSSFLQCTCLKS